MYLEHLGFYSYVKYWKHTSHSLPLQILALSSSVNQTPFLPEKKEKIDFFEIIGTNGGISLEISLSILSRFLQIYLSSSKSLL